MAKTKSINKQFSIISSTLALAVDALLSGQLSFCCLMIVAAFVLAGFPNLFWMFCDVCIVVLVIFLYIKQFAFSAFDVGYVFNKLVLRKFYKLANCAALGIYQILKVLDYSCTRLVCLFLKMLIAVLVVFVKLLYLVFVVIVVNVSTVKKSRTVFVFQIIVFLTHLDNTNATDSITKFYNDNLTTINIFSSLASIVFLCFICFVVFKIFQKSKNVQKQKLDLEHGKEKKVSRLGFKNDVDITQSSSITNEIVSEDESTQSSQINDQPIINQGVVATCSKSIGNLEILQVNSSTSTCLENQLRSRISYRDINANNWEGIKISSTITTNTATGNTLLKLKIGQFPVLTVNERMVTRTLMIEGKETIINEKVFSGGIYIVSAGLSLFKLKNPLVHSEDKMLEFVSDTVKVFVSSLCLRRKIDVALKNAAFDIFPYEPLTGPSCGVSFAIALLSIILDRAPPDDLCATGQITFNGDLKKIAGVKWKLEAAHAIGKKRIILPEENRDDFYNLSEEEKFGITPFFYNNFFDAFDLIYPQTI